MSDFLAASIVKCFELNDAEHSWEVKKQVFKPKAHELWNFEVEFFLHILVYKLRISKQN